MYTVGSVMMSESAVLLVYLRTSPHELSSVTRARARSVTIVQPHKLSERSAIRCAQPERSDAQLVWRCALEINLDICRVIFVFDVYHDHAVLEAVESAVPRRIGGAI